VMNAGKFGFIGFSLGGRVGFELAASHADRLLVLAIGGMHLLPPSIEEDRIERRIRVLRSGRARSVEETDGERPGNDALALAASQEALLRWQGAAGRLGGHKAPTMLFCGENDRYFANAKETASEMGYSFVALPGIDHEGTFFSSELSVRAVDEFVRTNLK